MKGSPAKNVIPASSWTRSLYWRASLPTPSAAAQPLHYVPMVTNCNLCVCARLCVCAPLDDEWLSVLVRLHYGRVAYFYIMNQLSRLWSELIWIIADWGAKKMWFFFLFFFFSPRASSHITCICSISPGEGAAMCVCVCVWKGNIMGRPTDSVCLPVCTLFAKPRLPAASVRRQTKSESAFWTKRHTAP